MLCVAKPLGSFFSLDAELKGEVTLSPSPGKLVLGVPAQSSEKVGLGDWCRVGLTPEEGVVGRICQLHTLLWGEGPPSRCAHVCEWGQRHCKDLHCIGVCFKI